MCVVACMHACVWVCVSLFVYPRPSPLFPQPFSICPPPSPLLFLSLSLISPTPPLLLSLCMSACFSPLLLFPVPTSPDSSGISVSCAARAWGQRGECWRRCSVCWTSACTTALCSACWPSTSFFPVCLRPCPPTCRPWVRREDSMKIREQLFSGIERKRKGQRDEEGAEGGGNEEKRQTDFRYTFGIAYLSCYSWRGLNENQRATHLWSHMRHRSR